MPEAFASLVGLLHWLPPLVLLWLAVFFGRTLRPGQVPLIERIARQGTPEMPQALCRYTRRLTAVWCAYFVLAAAFSVGSPLGFGRLNLLVWGGTIVLFVGERMIRPWLFPNQAFPGLIQQIRDTWHVWRPRR